MSMKDVQTLLDLFREATVAKSELSYTTICEFKKYRDNLLLSVDDGWTETLITIDSKDVAELGDMVITAPFNHRDMVKFLTSEFGNRNYKGRFVLRAYEDMRRGRRVYSYPYTCDAWLSLQSLLPEHAVIAGLQFYSDKTPVNMKNLSAHPVKCALLNVKYSTRIKNLQNVAYLTDLKRPTELTNDAVWRLVKLTYISKALDLLMQPLKVMSYTGVNLFDPSGKYQLVYPRLLNYVLDDPEGKDILCIKGGQAKHPCEVCWVPHEELLDVTCMYDARTEDQQRHAFYSLCSTRTQRRTCCPNLSATYSTHPVPSPLWGFCHQDQGVANSMWSLGYETMHNEDLGAFLYKVDNMGKALKAAKPDRNEGAAALKELNKRLGELPRAGND